MREMPIMDNDRRPLLKLPIQCVASMAVALALLVPHVQGQRSYYYFKDSKVFLANDSAQAIFQTSEKLGSQHSNCRLCYLNDSGERLFGTPCLSVRLKTEDDSTVLKNEAEKLGLTIIRQSDVMPSWYTLAVTASTALTSMDAAAQLYETGLFAGVEPDLVSEGAALFTYDTQAGNQWALHNRQYPGIDINVSEAWNYATGWNVKIAFVDQYIPPYNPDLAPNLDTLTYNTRHDGRSPNGAGSHGAYCAGVAAAVRNNGQNIAGVAPDAKIMSVSNPLDTFSTPREFANGISWAWKHGADVISCSWKINSPSQMIAEAIDSAITYGRGGLGCVVVFASGNDTTTHHMYPSELDNRIICVGAIEQKGTRWASSRYGTRLDVMAPGDKILATHSQSGTRLEGGTSLACPHVSGLAALILDRNPFLTASQVKNIIEQNTRKVGPLPYLNDSSHPNGTWNAEYGYGLIDATRAVRATPRADW